MVPGFLIGALAFVLFLYWLRHTCLLLLKQQFPRDHVLAVAEANGLRVIEVRKQLESRPRAAELPGIYRQIVRDYWILASLLKYTAVFEGGSYTLEQRLIALDFRVMQFVFLSAQVVAPKQARRALSEAVRVLEYFANAIGGRAIGASAR